MNKTNLNSILKKHHIKTLLVDASGVLYDEQGPFQGTKSSIKYLHDQGYHIFLATNNSSEYVSNISKRLAKHDIFIKEENIISSGFGLSYDANIQKLLQDKKVLVLGTVASCKYLENSGSKRIVNFSENSEYLGIENYQEAQIIVVTSYEEEQLQIYNQIIPFFKNKKPKIKIICCNPDKYVRSSENKLIPVAGYYAEKLGKALATPVLWFGKPYSNYSFLVKKHLADFGLACDASVCFFDDNHENVSRMISDLKIHGAVVTETGLFDVEKFAAKTDSQAKNLTHFIPHFHII